MDVSLPRDVRYRRWEPEIKSLWQRIRLDTGWGGAPLVRRLFGDERAAPAILEFLENTRVGKMPGRVLLAGGPDLEEEDLERRSLQVLGEEGEQGRVRARKRMDRAHPLRMYLSYVLFLC